MNLKRRAVSLGVFAAAAAGVTWAVATGTVDNYPATIQFNISVAPETVTSTTVQATPTIGGGTASASVSGNASTINLLVNGGDPDVVADEGYSYSTQIYTYLSAPAPQQTYLRFQPTGSVLVNNNASPASERSVTVPFSVAPSVSRVYGTVSVTGDGGAAKVASFYLYSSVTTPQGYFYGSTTTSSSTVPSLSAWTPTSVTSGVQVWGSATLRQPDGTYTQHSLATQSADTSAGPAVVDWTIDLSGLANLQGDVVANIPVGSTGNQYVLQYYGASSSNSGYYGSVSTTPSQPHYSIDLPAGDYDFYLAAYFNAPNSYNRSPLGRVTIAAGNNTHNFSTSFASAQTNVTVDGFYTNSSVNSVHTYLHDNTWNSYGHGYQLANGAIEQLVPPREWQSYYTYLRILDSSDPLLPTNAQIYRYHQGDGEFPPVDVNTSPIVADEHITLVRSHVFFDVKDEANALQVSSPSIVAYKTVAVPSGGTRQTSIYGYGSGTPQAVSGLTLIGEPGTYTISSATGSVNGQQTNFGGGTITFGNPVNTDRPDAGPGPVEVVLTDDPGDDDRLHVSLSFENVTDGGFSTVVETPIGPALPEGFRMSCPADFNEDGEADCAPLYYDINTTATWTGETKVCVRRRIDGDNWLAETLSLFHYNTALNNWEELPAPNDGTPARFDCSADPATCGCATEEECGIDPFADPPRNVFLVCGMATSFSPFAVLQRNVRFTNTVDGVTYTGPTGPPSLQRFVAAGEGKYRITAWGARGAKATATTGSANGGCGAKVTGDFDLQTGDALDILVGQMGLAATNNGGGGGGTFVLKSGAPILVAGGGGGIRSGATVDGRGGTLTTSGSAGSTSSSYASGFIAGGTGGAGGSRLASYGAGGGGWTGNGAADGNYGEGGFAFTGAYQGKGGLAKTCSGGLAHGGYGGGGSGNGCFGGGGGGGYSGGGGGRIGGGGGSLNTGARAHGVEGRSACTATGQGRVEIEFLGR